MVRSPIFVLIAILSLSACGENRVRRTEGRAAEDTNRVLTAWDMGDMEDLLRTVNAAEYMNAEEMAEAARELASLRKTAGATTLQTPVLIDGAPEDPDAYAIAHQVLATERGCGALTLVYNRDLRIVGFLIRAQPLVIADAR